MSWSRPGPGRPFAMHFAQWRQYLTPLEKARVETIEAIATTMKPGRPPKREKVSAADKYEYATLRNRAVKRAAWVRRAVE